MKNLLPPLLALVLVTGCASEETGTPSEKTWYQQGKSPDETIRDLAACQNEALSYGRAYSPISADSAGRAIVLGWIASDAESSREDKIVKTCMVAKGYTMLDNNSPLSSESTTTQAAYISPQTEQPNVIPQQVAANLIGHWLLAPPPTTGVRGQWDMYFLPHNRYKSDSSLTTSSGQSIISPTSEAGRYYFVGNKLVMWGDENDKPDSPDYFDLTDTEFNLSLDGSLYVFQRQSH